MKNRIPPILDPQNINFETTDLTPFIGHQMCVDTDASIGDLCKIFQDDEYNYVTVLKGRNVMGVCSQVHLSSLWAGHFGHALFDDEPVTFHMEQDIHILRQGTRLRDALQSLFSQSNHDMNQDVILVDEQDAYLGNISSHLIILLQQRLLDMQLKQTQEMHEQVIEMNRQLKSVTEEAMKASKVKSSFLANMSHEIRTPMNGIMGMSQLLTSTGLNETQSEYVKDICSCSETLLNIIDDILDLSKVESSAFELEIIPINIRELVRSLCRLLDVNASERGLELVCIIKRHVPEQIMGDPTRIRQVLMNLLSNAIKFTIKGHIYLEVDYSPSSMTSGELLFVVEDTGIGMTSAVLEKVFNPFVQADTSTTRKFGGTGLGLTISRQLARLMSGDLLAESRPGMGTSFYFTASVDALNTNAYIDTDFPFAHKRLISLCATPLSAKALFHAAACIGIEPIVSHTPAQIIDRIATSTTRFDYLVLDAHVSEADQQNVLSALQTNPLLSATKRVAFCGLNQDPPKHMSRSDFSIILRKPLFPHDLQLALTCKSSDRKPSDANSPASQKPGHPFALGKRALLAEDNAVNQKVISRLLQKIGVDVFCVPDGKQAIEAFAQYRFDIVFMDIQMPVMDGLEAAAEIRRLPNGATTPIIVVTANAMKGERERFLAMGFDGYVAKPIKNDQLYHVFNNHFAQETPLENNLTNPLQYVAHSA
jgi:signal transduction histidine kinase/CheY-like chemotaxis protein